VTLGQGTGQYDPPASVSPGANGSATVSRTSGAGTQLCDGRVSDFVHVPTRVLHIGGRFSSTAYLMLARFVETATHVSELGVECIYLRIPY
jgi:hypothetical protein